MIAAVVAAVSAEAGGGCALNRTMYGPGEAVFSHQMHVFVDRGGTRTRRYTWGNPPAHEALDFLRYFLTFDDDPPAPTYVASFDDPSWLGVFTGAEIRLRNDLDVGTERWVALHEILHWAGFGGGDGQTEKPGTARIYRDDVRDVTADPRITKSHWDDDTMTGTHRRSNRGASHEIMTPRVGIPFLAAATLHNLGRVTERHWCTSSEQCTNGRICSYPNNLFPGWCNHVPSGFRGPPPADFGKGSGPRLSTGAIVGLVLGSAAGVTLLGFIGRKLWRTRATPSANADIGSSANGSEWLLATDSF